MVKPEYSTMYDISNISTLQVT